jgi:4-hydroxyphenylpyruvate dioxygenase
MRYSIATVCLSGTLETKIGAISKAGFGCIEIFENDLVTSRNSPETIATMICDAGLETIVYQPFRDFEGLAGKLRAKAFDRAERKFDLMTRLDTDLLMVCSSVHTAARPGISRIADDLRELADRAAQRNMRVAYEALGWSHVISDYRDSWEAVRQANHPALGLCLDTFHIYSRQTEIDSVANIPGEKIFLVQIADAPRLSMDPLSWSRHHRCFPGQGQLDLDQFMERLRQTGYDGPLSLEIFNDQFRAGNADSVALDGHRSLVYLNQSSSELTSSQPAELESAQEPGGVEFIEFAVGDTEYPRLSETLRALGFTLSATHKAKHVERWTQGNVNLVFNREDGSFANRYYDLHGLSVCAYGLSVDEPENMVKRANQLSYPVSYGDPNTDTHGLPAIMSPDGAQLYFVDPNEQDPHWDREFVSNDEATENSWIETVDHIAVTMGHEQSMQATLLYKALFNLNPTSPLNVLDPSGLVRSQVFESTNRNVAFTINSTGARRTVASQTLEKYAGSGVNHIAFRTKKIFEIAERMKSLSVEVMDVTDNYYDDLSSRFDLSSNEIQRLKQLHILYDEDKFGSFFQIFTKLIYGRFCFEIVQRDGYRGYGFPNAQLRLTMQAADIENQDA